MKSLTQKNTFLIDWDGCLAKTLDLWMNSYKRIYKEYNLDLTEKNILITSWGKSELGPKKLGIKDYLKAYKKITNQVEMGSKTIEMYDYAIEFLKLLKLKGKKTAIITSSKKELILPALKYHKLENYIIRIITDSEVKNPKPAPDICIKAVKILNSTFTETVIIGDTEKDIISGKACGISTVLILHKENQKYYNFKNFKKLNPDFVFNGFYDLIKIIS